MTVWSRELDGQPMAGRLRIAHAIRELVKGAADVRSLTAASLFSDFKPARLVRTGLSFLAYLLRGELLPLQCVAYADYAEIKRLLAETPSDAAVVYVDGARLYPFVRALRKRSPTQRIVVDLDDLMSRRFDLLLRERQPLALGQLGGRLPSAVKAIVNAEFINRLVLAYERMTLKSVEHQLMKLATEVVLLSDADAAELASGSAHLPAPKAGINATPPPAELADLQAPQAPFRFIFIGTDALTQNRLTIDYLIDLWRKHRPDTELVIYGKQKRELELPAGVTVTGYVNSLDDVYTPSSILITPSFIGGGVKTKVLEAFARGTPVIGNRRTFESLPLEGYPLWIEDEVALLDVIKTPSAHEQTLKDAGLEGHRMVRDRHHPQKFAAQWRQILGLSPGT